MSKKRSAAQMPASVLWCLLASAPTAAQIAPDATLPVNSLVTPQGNIMQIDGGTRAGNNLLHSFSQFSVPTGGTAFFNNAVDVGNIFSRVTGGSISNIDGILKANGTANLFLLNPAGIIFGREAALNIGGSFVASTASSVKFSDDSFFSATNPIAQPLLTINVPVGLQFDSQPGSLVNQSRATVPDRSQPIGLAVPPGKTLALVGGDLALAGGYLTASGGRIELGSVLGASQVSLTPTASGFAIGYAGVQNFGDIQLSSGAVVDTSGWRGGEIQIQAHSFQLSQNSSILSLTQGTQPGGTIALNAVDTVQITGTGSYLPTLNTIARATVDISDLDTSLFTGSLGSGAAGDIVINTRQLIARNGAVVLTPSFGSGHGGKLTINASDSLTLSASAIGTLTAGGARGNSGNVIINTGVLNADKNNLIGTTSFGNGNSGQLTVNATESVNLIGDNPVVIANIAFIRTGFYTTAFRGDVGDLEVNTQRLIIQNGGIISAVSGSSRPAGNITINAAAALELLGKTPDGRLFSGLNASTSLLASSTSQSLAGNINITTGRLTIKDGAQIRLVSLGNAGGNLEIFANSIELDNQGAIAATSSFREGGNIQLQTDSLQLRHNSQISATAGVQGGTSNGGNININTNTAVLLENSQISANAFQGRGGNIQISTQGLFRSPDSAICASQQRFAIAASSAAGAQLNGVVSINTPSVDSNLGLVALPAEVVDASRLIAQGCSTPNSSTRSRFVVTGQGGLPPNPGETLTSDAVWEDLRTSSSGAKNGYTNTAVPKSAPESPLVEATGWEIDSRGVVKLTAPTATIGGLTQKTCNAR